jgi:surface protein
MEGMFEGCIDFNRNIKDWDTSNVTNMSRMFQSCFCFFQDLGNWNTGKVVDMSYMFYGVTFVNEYGVMIPYVSDPFHFPPNFNNWDTSNVENMAGMFTFVPVPGHSLVTEFNVDLSNWNTSKVTNMVAMFYGCSKFNKPIGNWNTSNVVEMSAMFQGCKNFNQDISRWNTVSVTDMSNMFVGCTSFKCDISVWDTSSVQFGGQMFSDGFDPDKKPIFRKLPDPFKMVIVDTPNGKRIGHLIFNSHPKYAVIKAAQKFLYTLDATGNVVPTKDRYIKLHYNRAKEDYRDLDEYRESQVDKLNKAERMHSLNVTETQLFPKGTYDIRTKSNLAAYLGGKKRKTKRKHNSKGKTRNVRDRARTGDLRLIRPSL